jgi:short subunit dehydrogenase-like uncharacterized protein
MRVNRSQEFVIGRSDPRRRQQWLEGDRRQTARQVSQIAAQLREIVILVNWPGPFSATARALVNASIEARVHYVDGR